jgi:hypothetical protein
MGQSNVQRSIEYEKLIYFHYKKGDNEEPLLETKKDKDGNNINVPVIADNEALKNDIESFNKSHKKDLEAHHNWLFNEKVDFSFASVALDDLPDNLSRKEMEVLIEFIKEEE